MLCKHLLGSLIALAILSSPFSLYAQSSPLTIQPSSGFVGIGTTSPTTYMHIKEDTGTQSLPILRIEQTGTTYGAFLAIKQSGLSTGREWTMRATGLGNFKITDETAVADRMFIDTTGKVGIGITSPTTSLHVLGDITATGTKYFEIDHPLDPNKALVHAALEGPEPAVYYRGEARLQKGEATIVLPDYFEALTQKQERTVQLTAIGSWSPLYVVEDIKGGRFTVRADQGSPSQRFFWEVKAVRADVPRMTVAKAKPPKRLTRDD